MVGYYIFFIFFFVIIQSNAHFQYSKWDNVSGNITKIHSSLSCHKTFYNFKCTFTNLCYNTMMDFIFLLSEESVFFGLNSREDLMSIHTSSVLNNSAFFLKLNVLDESYVNNAIFIDSAVFVLHRFKPDNIMHVIHDDLLPLYASYKEICLDNISNCVAKFKLAFIDNNFPGPFIEWYSAFSYSQPLFLSVLNPNQTYCFPEIRVGLSLDTIFYKYGYNEARGTFTNKLFNEMLVSDFSKYVLRYFKINKAQEMLGQITVISRQLNRKILNENYIDSLILDTMKKLNYTDIKILKLDILGNSTVDILGAVSNSFCLLGIHGSGMILSIFLPKNARVIELFPYGIKKESVSPIFILSKKLNINFSYFSWENSNIFHSFPHPEYPTLLGGVHSFPEIKKTEVINGLTTDSSMKQCCHNPTFLYNMFQDTVVDDSIIPVFEKALAFKNITEDMIIAQFKQWFFPSIVRNITCFIAHNGLLIYWSPPFNVKLRYECVYHLTATVVQQNITISTNSTFLFLETDLISGNNTNSNVHLWITCECDGINGIETYHTCF